MIIKNDSPNHPLQFILEDGTVIGQFYNSRDKLYHLAIYIPNKQPPTEYLCCKIGNFSPSRGIYNRPKCPTCWMIVEPIENILPR